MVDLTKNIREYCHVNTNDNGDSFVGIKIDTDGMKIYFPMGYQLPENDEELRIDIHNLFGVLSKFMKEDKVVELTKFEKPKKVNFPMHAYLKVIRHFLRTGQYYIETDPIYKTDTKGRISWSKTLKKQSAMIQKNGSLIFTNMIVRSNTPNIDKKITQIHRYCVYEAFDKIGIIYIPYMPDKPSIHPTVKESIYILQKKLALTHNDIEQELFTAMRDMLIYEDEKGDDKQIFFGTDHFESVWEKMIDRAFGIDNKEKYFPRTKWLLDTGFNKEKNPLIPDSIMIYGDKYYVLDSKYYRYGIKPVGYDQANYLPNSSDINKQITYGEYIERTRKLPNEKLFNAFIMPFNKENNNFKITSNVGNIGEAIGDWRWSESNPYMKNYERIQGILIDTRYLMYNYNSISDEQKKELSECIEKVLKRGIIPSPKIY